MTDRDSQANIPHAGSGMEGSTYDELWAQAATAPLVGGFRAVSITAEQLKRLVEDPRWRNVCRDPQPTIKAAGDLGAGFYGTIGDMALFVRFG